MTLIHWTALVVLLLSIVSTVVRPSVNGRVIDGCRPEMTSAEALLVPVEEMSATRPSIDTLGRLTLIREQATERRRQRILIAFVSKLDNGTQKAATRACY
jgi:hypothetical protein